MSWLEGLGASGTLATMLVAIVAGASCAIVGSFLVLRRMGLLGDAISHAVLPGLVIGFMVSGTRELWPMLLGAIAAGLLTTWLTALLERRASLEANAGMGVVFTTLFAIGVVLINLFGERVDLDPGCVLYGQIGVVAIDTVAVAGLEVPRALLPLGGMLAFDVLAVLLLWKELKISSFDPALATTVGLSAGGIHYTLMTLVATTTVACFESVGSILVIAMLIVPGATAHLLTDRLAPLLLIAVVVSTLAAVLGCLLAVHFDVSEAGMIAVAGGAIFGVTVVLAPRHGLVARWLRQLALALRILEEDILARLYRFEERAEAPPAGGWAEAGIHAPRLNLLLALAHLRLRRLIRATARGFELAPAGRARARQLVRSHRAWEAFLREAIGLPLDHLHEPAHRMEHFIDDDIAEAILDRLDRPMKDPHGRRIPELD